MSSSWDLDDLIAELSAAALDPGHWKPALQRLSDTVGAVGTVLLPPPGQRFDSVCTDAIAEPGERYIKEGWQVRDLRDRGYPKMIKRGITVDLDYATEDDFRKSDYYNDFLGRHGLRWFAGVAVAIARDDFFTLSIQRSLAQGPFAAGEQDQLMRLRAPLGAAATVSRELGLAATRGLADAFDVLGSAAVIVDRHGQVLRANRTAETALTAELRIVNRRLRALEHDLSNRIDRLVGRAAASWSETTLGPPLAIPRLGRRPLLVYAVPLAGEALDVFSAARALVIVVDLDARAVPAETHLRHALGLTSAEARLAQQMAGGEALGTAANLLRIGKETARSQLKAVFAKTGTQRQSELVALIARLLARPHRGTGAGG
jgi:DNA-binding CsgD family transcriptional regulator